MIFHENRIVGLSLQPTQAEIHLFRAKTTDSTNSVYQIKENLTLHGYIAVLERQIKPLWPHSNVFISFKVGESSTNAEKLRDVSAFREGDGGIRNLYGFPHPAFLFADNRVVRHCQGFLVCGETVGG